MHDDTIQGRQQHHQEVTDEGPSTPFSPSTILLGPTMEETDPLGVAGV